ncbi:DUF3099 domain-containing protein [Microbacterium sp. BWT-B31]|uniref:DUF3099 domain-containing protein n=1 Tax=Microbacterium sp. BWT-B31 TaxID=3232072 RepID=UPI003529454B
MKNSTKATSATSLPRAPRDDASARSKKYIVMMSVRVVCFLLMVLVTPYGWYTWIFAAGAIFLPYIAVVIANVGKNEPVAPIESPERALPQAPTTRTPARSAADTVIRIEETRSLPVSSDDAPPQDGTAA